MSEICTCERTHTHNRWPINNVMPIQFSYTCYTLLSYTTKTILQINI